MRFIVFNTFAFLLLWIPSAVALPAKNDLLPGIMLVNTTNSMSVVVPLKDDKIPGITPIEDTPGAQVASALAYGINCKGNINCKSYCQGPHIDAFVGYLDRIPDDVIYQSGKQVACVKCRGKRRTSICLFPQRLKTDEQISAKTLKEKVKGLKDHGCAKCGSNPVHGNDGADGEVTLNIVSNGCGTGICPYSW